MGDPIPLREDIPKIKLLTFGHFPKGGRGFSLNPKDLGSFSWAFFWTYPKEGGGLNQFQKFEVVLKNVLGFLKVTFGGLFVFSNQLKQLLFCHNNKVRPILESSLILVVLAEK